MLTAVLEEEPSTILRWGPGNWDARRQDLHPGSRRPQNNHDRTPGTGGGSNLDLCQNYGAGKCDCRNRLRLRQPGVPRSSRMRLGMWASLVNSVIVQHQSNAPGWVAGGCLVVFRLRQSHRPFDNLFCAGESSNKGVTRVTFSKRLLGSRLSSAQSF
jgi:hypothetical protein